MMTNTVNVILRHRSSIPGARWCEPQGWEPANYLEGSEFLDGSWWDEDENTAGLIYFGEGAEDEIVTVSLEDVRVASCGDCRVLGEVTLAKAQHTPRPKGRPRKGTA